MLRKAPPYRRVVSEIPNAQLADLDKGFAVDGALGHAVQKHVSRVEPEEAINVAIFKEFAHGLGVKQQLLVVRCAHDISNACMQLGFLSTQEFQVVSLLFRGLYQW